jgi:sugar phosphate isomerase/epimerase
MISPPGMNVTTSDVALRTKSWDHIRHLIDLAADLGANSILVFGSPKQRNTVAGVSRPQAVRNFTDELAKVTPQAEQRGVRILVEALPSNQCDVINTLAEAVAIVDQIGSPAIQTMFDVHNAVDETEPHAELLKRYFEKIAHVHVNEIDGKEPGMGDYDFASLLRELTRLGFKGWVSLEAFDFSRAPETIAGGSLRYLQSQLNATGRNAGPIEEHPV